MTDWRVEKFGSVIFGTTGQYRQQRMEHLRRAAENRQAELHLQNARIPNQPAWGGSTTSSRAGRGKRKVARKPRKARSTPAGGKSRKARSATPGVGRAAAGAGSA